MTIKFAIQIEPQFGFDYNTIKEIALQAEILGYDALWVSDHLFLDNKSEEKYCLEAWTLLGALAADTDTIRLGTLVTGNNYRYPAILAKIASTVDMISQGRLNFGIGTGWKEIEYKAYGIEFPSIKDRMDQLEESIQIILKLWSEAKVSFEGKHYSIKDAFSSPKPMQKPRPPIFIGGSGKQRIMKMVAKYGDYLNLPFTAANEIEGVLDALKQHCQDLGRDYDSIGKSYFMQVYIGETQEDVEKFIKERAERNKISVDDLKKRFDDGKPGSWTGTPEDLIERINYMQTLGFDYFVLMFMYPNDLKQSELFAKKVMNVVNA